MKPYLSIMTAGLLAFSISDLQAEVDTKLQLSSGYNSNPFRFNQQFAPQGSQYLQAKGQLDYTFKRGWSLGAGVDAEYYDQASDANQHNLSTDLSYRSGKASDYWQLKAMLKHRDKTYISRLTGERSRYAGEYLDDRYDYRQGELEWTKKDKLSRTLSHKWQLSYQRRDYQDYDQLNISDLDYQSFSISDQLRWKISKRQRHYFSAELTLRDYLNREQKNLQGDSLSNTELQYRYFSLGYRYRYTLKKRVEVNIEPQFELRRDNGSGYYDSDTIELASALEYRWSRHHQSQLDISYRDFSYGREPGLANDVEEEFNGEKRIDVSLNHTIKAPSLLGKKGAVKLSYEYRSADANRSAYQYDRSIVSAALSVRF
ncbi:MAG: hypothetical protein AAFN68_00920 [Pseudomonadota bacterium]